MNDSFSNQLIDASDALSVADKVIEYKVVGSSVYMDTARDVDVLVLVNGDNFLDDCRWLMGSGWELVSGEYAEDLRLWGVVRKGNIDLIMTCDAEFYEGFAMASRVCHALGLQKKSDRIIVHRIVRDGYCVEAALSDAALHV